MGLRLALGTLDVFRTSVGAASVGMARRALDEAVSRVMRRVQFGKPLSEQQLTQAALADMATELDAARLLVARAAWEKDHEDKKTRSDGVSVLSRVGLLTPGAAPRFARTFMGALGGGVPGPGPGAPPSLDFRARVTAVYEAMQSALRRGDLAAFGAAYRDLGALLGRR